MAWNQSTVLNMIWPNYLTFFLIYSSWAMIAWVTFVVVQHLYSEEPLSSFCWWSVPAFVQANQWHHSRRYSASFHLSSTLLAFYWSYNRALHFFMPKILGLYVSSKIMIKTTHTQNRCLTRVTKSRRISNLMERLASKDLHTAYNYLVLDDILKVSKLIIATHTNERGPGNN